MTGILQLGILFSIIAHVQALKSGFYAIQNVATRKYVVAYQQALPLFAEARATPHKKDFSVWHVEKHGSGAYKIENTAIQLPVQVYRETHNTTIVVLEKKATLFDIEWVGKQEWMIRLPGTKSVWTVNGPYDQVSIERTEGEATQRFRFHQIHI